MRSEKCCTVKKRGAQTSKSCCRKRAQLNKKKVDIAWKSRYYWYVLPEPWCCSRPRIKARNGQSNNTKRSSCSLQAQKGWTNTMGLKSLLVAFDFFLPSYYLTIHFVSFCGLRRTKYSKNVSLNHKDSKMQHPIVPRSRKKWWKKSKFKFSSVKKKHTAAIQIQTSDKAHTVIRGVKHLL